MVFCWYQGMWRSWTDVSIEAYIYMYIYIYIRRFSSFWGYFLKVVPVVFVLDVLILSVYFMKFRENYIICIYRYIYIYHEEYFQTRGSVNRHVWFWVFVSSSTNFSHESVSFFPFSLAGARCCRRRIGSKGGYGWKMYLPNLRPIEAGCLGSSFKGHDMAWYYLYMPILRIIWMFFFFLRNPL